ncbi:RHS repeat-associated core domain-containing protein, partial [Enterobacter cloacae]|uniref:RHS repeat-associated core domain-containing protein n=1 Tax=Enterobacter cloacae TaxID=550 RepID=UPI0021CE2531
DATGLLYYGYRYYQPDAGRWLSADPGGLIDGLNLFRFCRDNPVCGRDDNGLVYQGVNDTIEKKYIKAEGWEIVARGVEPQPIQGKRLWGKAPVFGLKEEERERLDNDLGLARAMVFKTRTSLELGDYTGLEKFLGDRDTDISVDLDFIKKIIAGYLKIEKNIAQREVGGVLRDSFVFSRPKSTLKNTERNEINKNTFAMIFPDDQHKRIFVNQENMAKVLPTTRAEKYIHEISHQELMTNDDWYLRQVENDSNDSEFIFPLERMQGRFIFTINNIPTAVSGGQTETSEGRLQWLLEQADTWALIPYFYLDERRYNNENDFAARQGFTDKRMMSR